MQEIDRIPPNCEETEHAVIALMLAHDLAAREAAASLTQDDFYNVSNGRLFDLLAGMVRDARDLDYPSVRPAMDAAGIAWRVLEVAQNSRPSILSLETYIDRLKDLRQRRRVLIGCQRILTALDNGELPDRCQDFRAILDATPTREHGRTIGELLADLELLTPVARLSTGLTDLDRGLQGGFVPGLYILAGSPGSGKSTLARTVARLVALGGTQTILVTLEDSAAQAVRRIWCAEARVPVERLEARRLQPAEAERLKYAAVELTAAPLTISDGPNDLGEIEGYLLGLARRGVRLACLDQLSWIAAPGDTQLERVSGISRRLRMVAARAGITVLLCSQINRAGCARESGPTPTVFYLSVRLSLANGQTRRTC